MACTESFLSQAFEYWQMTVDHPYIIGDFVWTALDYLGEAGIGRWYLHDPKDTAKELFMGSDGLYPWHGSDCGDLDICGFRKASSHYRNIVWDRGEKLYLGVRLPVPEGKELRVTRWGVWPVYPSWTWPGMEGKPLEVEIYSRCRPGAPVPRRQTDRREAHHARRAIHGELQAALCSGCPEGRGSAGRQASGGTDPADRW